MSDYIRSPESVELFLQQVKPLALRKECTIINNTIWKDGKINKTQRYMAEKNITGKQIRDTIQELTVQNYSMTSDDRNVNFADEEVWIFGLKKCMVDEEEELYIKLKIRELKGKKLLILSFHPEQPAWEGGKLQFPYKEYNNQINKITL